MQNYYTILSQQTDNQTASFVVYLNADCPVYAGHFPGNPIAPGACNIEMIRQCASLALGHTVRFSTIRLCKFMMILRPGETEQLVIQISWTGNRMSAVILADGTPAVQLKMDIQ